MQLNQLAYEEGFSVDAMFGAKILMLIDRRVQNYLKKGYDPATRRMAETHLLFQVPQNQVVDGKFQYANIPHNILKVYQKQKSGAAAPRRTGSIPVPSDSLPIENPMPLPSLQASEDHLQYLLLSVHNNGPCWGGDGRPCPRYHSAGLVPLATRARWPIPIAPLQTRNYLTTQPGTNYVSHVFMNVSSLFLDIGPKGRPGQGQWGQRRQWRSWQHSCPPPPPDKCSTWPKMA
jgi:hypothetical protein